MKTILCYGDSNTWGAKPVTKMGVIHRYDLTERWPGVLRQALGDGHWVVEEGLNGRTTVWDDAVQGVHKNGRTYLYPCLETHHPIDLVVLMLGTNDLKQRFSVTAQDIALSVSSLVDIIRKSPFGPNGGAPKILLMCPPPLGKLTLYAEMLEGGAEKSRRLAQHYRTVAETYGCEFLDTAQVIVSSDVDGLHLEASEHQKLGNAVAATVKKLLA